MACVLGVFQARNHGLRRANFLGELGLCQIRIFTHFTNEQGQINLLHGPGKDLSVGRTLAGALTDNLSVLVAFHRLNSFKIASFSSLEP